MKKLKQYIKEEIKKLIEIKSLDRGPSLPSNPNNPDCIPQICSSGLYFSYLTFKCEEVNTPPKDFGKAPPMKGPKRRGCTDPEALNYEEDAEIDDGSCWYPQDRLYGPDAIEGCTDPAALNYNPEADMPCGEEYDNSCCRRLECIYCPSNYWNMIDVVSVYTGYNECDAGDCDFIVTGVNPFSFVYAKTGGFYAPVPPVSPQLLSTHVPSYGDTSNYADGNSNNVCGAWSYVPDGYWTGLDWVEQDYQDTRSTDVHDEFEQLCMEMGATADGTPIDEID